jgi:hypothetical protein
MSVVGGLGQMGGQVDRWTGGQVDRWWPDMRNGWLGGLAAQWQTSLLSCKEEHVPCRDGSWPMSAMASMAIASYLSDGEAGDPAGGRRGHVLADPLALLLPRRAGMAWHGTRWGMDGEHPRIVAPSGRRDGRVLLEDARRRMPAGQYRAES